MFQNVSAIDEVVYVRYETPAANPIWGAFQRWARQPSVYAPFQTTVEIRYAAHLPLAWRRLVVTKELCHSLEADQGTFSASDASVDRLVNYFALLSTQADDDPNTVDDAIVAEAIAETCAVEILCPLVVRRGMLDAGRTPDEIADEYDLPKNFMRAACRKSYMTMVDKLLGPVPA